MKQKLGSKSQMQKGGHVNIFNEGLMDQYTEYDSSRNKIDKKLGEQMHSKLSLDHLKTVNNSYRSQSPYQLKNFASIHVARSNQKFQQTPIRIAKKQNAS